MPMKKQTPLRVPVTAGLKDIYALDMHTAYQAACLGKFNVELFGRLATAIAVVLTALEHKDSKLPQALETLDAAVAALVQVKKRGDASDVWELTASELPVILDGIFMVEQCIGTLDVALLKQTASELGR
jgi:hypothetical protein